MFRLTGEREVAIALENRARASSEASRQVLKDYAEEIADLAYAQAPKDTGALEESIDTKQIKAGGFGRRNVWVVYVRGWELHKSGKQVGFYAYRMHDDEYRLGPGSQEKQNKLKRGRYWTGSNVYVGPEYLTRALDYYYDDILEELEIASSREIERRILSTGKKAKSSAKKRRGRR